MIAVRLDESGTHEGSPVCVVAGYIAGSVGVDSLHSELQQALVRHDYPRIHMRELEAGKSKLSSPERKIPLFRDVIEILRQHALAGIAGYILRSDYDRYVADTDYAHQYSPYSLCLMLCAHAAQIWANTHGRVSENIEFVLDRGGGHGKYAELMIGLMMEYEWKTRYNFGQLNWGDDTVDLTLQAADMIAYEARKHALRHHGLPRAGLKVRELLKGLLGCVPHVALTPDERFWISIRSGIFPVALLSPKHPRFPDLSKHPPQWD